MRALGLVLAGGRSTRFGSEKALAVVAGRPMIAAVAEALLGGCAAVAVNAPEASGAAAWARAQGSPLLSDRAGDPDGPLSGVRAGLDYAEAEGFAALVTAPCDTPFLPEDFAARLLAGLEEAPCAYALSPDGPHPPCAAFRLDRRKPLEAVLAEGHPSMRLLLDGWGAARTAFPQAAAFRNVNTPEEAASARDRSTR